VEQERKNSIRHHIYNCWRKVVNEAEQMSTMKEVRRMSFIESKERDVIYSHPDLQFYT